MRLPWSPDGAENAYEAWARVATLMAGADRGSWFIPDVDDEVLVGSPEPPTPVASSVKRTAARRKSGAKTG